MSAQRPTSITLLAAADLSASQFFGVKIDANGRAALATAGDVVGIVQNDPDALDKAATVCVHGLSKAVAGGNIARGDKVTTDAAGKIVAATSGRTNTGDAGAANDPLIGSYVLGIALEPAAANEVFEVLVLQLGAIPQTVQ
jgi:hypothetical protein